MDNRESPSHSSCLKLVLGEYFGEVSLWVCRQLAGWSHLDDAPVTKHDDHITVADCAEPVCDDDDCAVGKLSLDYVVNYVIRLNVNGCCCLIHYLSMHADKEISPCTATYVRQQCGTANICPLMLLTTGNAAID